MPGLKHLFTSITDPRQRQYEAIRAIEIDNLSVSNVAKKFGYQVNSLYPNFTTENRLTTDNQ